MPKIRSAFAAASLTSSVPPSRSIATRCGMQARAKYLTDIHRRASSASPAGTGETRSQNLK